jgi:SHS2 domain-containing protein
VSGGRFELLDHTGDIAFRAEALDWPGLLDAATAALGAVVLAPSPGEPCHAERAVEVSGADREDVLVAWLGEALFRFEAEGFLARGARVEAAGETGARGVLRGRVLAPGEAVDRVVKAVTYHDLSVEAGAGERPWRVTVVLDL